MTSAASTPPEEFQGRLAEGVDWKQIVAWVGDLPPMPQVASRAMNLIEDPNASAGALSTLLSRDAALAARVLKIANSAMFACQRSITTLNQAIMIIGFKTLKGLIVAASLDNMKNGYDKMQADIWENSTATAANAHLIALHLRKNYAEEAFLLGLLHDLGKLVFATQIRDDYQEIVNRCADGHLFVRMEEEKLGCSHALVGALVAKKWNYSPDTCKVILHHHDPIDIPFQSPMEEKAFLINTADQIAHAQGHAHPEGYPDLTEDARSGLIALGVAEDDVDTIFQKCQGAYDDLKACLS